MSNNARTDREIYKALAKSAGVKPEDVQGQGTLRTKYYKQILYHIIAGCFKISADIPVNYDYIRESLIWTGKIGAFECDYGIILYYPNMTGVNIYNQPTDVIYTLSGTGTSYERVIGTDTEIVYLFGLKRGGFADMISIYAEKLASADGTIDVNLINSRTPLIVEAENAQQKASAEKMYDDASRGKPLILLRRTADGRGANVYPAKLTDHFIVDKVQDAKRTIMNEFLTTIGINNANTDKRERLNSDEVHSNDAELDANIALIKKCLSEQLPKVNAMFPALNLDIRFEPPKSIAKGGAVDGDGK